MLVNLPAAKKVHAAIKAGARTQREIRRMTKLLEDEVCDALAHLLLTVRTIRTETDGTTRWYVLTERREVKHNESPLSFSNIRCLMPSSRFNHPSNSEAEPYLRTW